MAEDLPWAKKRRIRLAPFERRLWMAGRASTSKRRVQVHSPQPRAGNSLRKRLMDGERAKTEFIREIGQ